MPTAPVDPEEQRRLQEREAARLSKLFAGTSEREQAATLLPSVTTDGTGATAAVAGPSAGGGQPTGADADVRQNGQEGKLAFVNAATDKRTVSPDRLQAAASPYVLQAGTLIARALLTGIQSDLPGQITGQVTENVYDSPTGRYLLIPQGAKLIGIYDSQVTFGQSRVLLVWTRLIMPNGRSIVLERQPGTDTQGYSGLEDGVDNHWGQLFKAALLSTLLSVGSEAGTTGQQNDLIQAIRQGASNSFSQTGQQIVGRQLNILGWAGKHGDRVNRRLQPHDPADVLASGPAPIASRLSQSPHFTPTHTRATACGTAPPRPLDSAAASSRTRQDGGMTTVPGSFTLRCLRENRCHALTLRRRSPYKRGVGNNAPSCRSPLLTRQLRRAHHGARRAIVVRRDHVPGREQVEHRTR